MDVDIMQHVNNARYLNFLEEARLSYSQEAIGLFDRLSDLNVVVARIEIDFIMPLFYPQEVVIWTRVNEIGKKSFQFSSILGIESQNNFEPAAKTLQTLVYFSAKERKSTAIPSDIKQKIMQFEEKR